MTTPDLKPCPFCGCSKNIAMVNTHHDHSGGYYIGCPDCGASTELVWALGDDPYQVLSEKWNRRAATRALAAQAAPAEPVHFLGVDPMNPTAGAVLPMIPDSWRFGFSRVDGRLCFGLQDNGPFVAYAAAQPVAWIAPKSLAWLQENPQRRVLETQLRGVAIIGWAPLYASPQAAQPVADTQEKPE